MMVVLEHSVEKPLNREPPIKELISSFITTKGGYDRNHGPTPHLDADRHLVRVDGPLIEKPLDLRIADLQAMPQHSVTCALQCAGNRRHTMRTRLKEVDGIDWFDGAVMNCLWRGPRLRDVLLKAGVNCDNIQKAHVAFACHQTRVQDDSWYGGSIELSRAMGLDFEVVVALEMNGKPLTIDKGAPVRIIAPGIAGARSVKWLDRITVQLEESKNHYQRHDYKILPPEVTDLAEAEKYWDSIPAIQEMPINSVIGYPESGETVTPGEDGTIEVKGYALPQGSDGPVIKVEVSGDDGKSWQLATLINGGESQSKWCWVLWTAKVTLAIKTKKILSRATDKGGNTQSESADWNLRGVAYNSYGETKDLVVLDNAKRR